MVHLNHTQLVLFCHVIQCLLKKNITVSWCHIGTTVKFQIICEGKGPRVNSGHRGGSLMGGCYAHWTQGWEDLLTCEGSHSFECLEVIHNASVVTIKVDGFCKIPKKVFWEVPVVLDVPLKVHGGGGKGWDGDGWLAYKCHWTWVNYLWQGKMEQGGGKRLPQVELRVNNCTHNIGNVLQLHPWYWHLSETSLGWYFLKSLTLF